MFDRAVERAGVVPSTDVTLHTLRHTAVSRMIAEGHNDHTVMAISGHSSTRMLERYTHPTPEHKIGALESFRTVLPDTNLAQTPEVGPVRTKRGTGIPRVSERFVGGRQEARTPDLRVANAALSQLS
jgi:hypothetical protein